MVVVQIQQQEASKTLVFNLIQIKCINGQFLSKDFLQFNDYLNIDKSGYLQYRITECKNDSVWCLNTPESHSSKRLYILKYNKNTKQVSVSEYKYQDLSSYGKTFIRGVTAKGREILVHFGYVINIDSSQFTVFERKIVDLWCGGSTLIDDNTAVFQCPDEKNRNYLVINSRKALQPKSGVEILKLESKPAFRVLKTQAGYYPAIPSYRDDIMIPLETSPDTKSVAFWALYPEQGDKDKKLWLCLLYPESGKTEKIINFPDFEPIIRSDTDFFWHPNPETPQIAVVYKGNLAVIEVNTKRIIATTGYSQEEKSNSALGDGSIINARWAPDGKSIYYLIIKNRLFSICEIRKLSLDTGKIEVVDEGVNYTDFFFIK
jgi:hypothetical protein